MNTKKNIPNKSEHIDLQVLREHCDSLELSSNNDLNFWLYCNIAMTTGLRSVDILQMKVSDVNFINGTVAFRERKSNKKVNAPIREDILSRINKDNEFVIWSEKYKGTVSLMTINRRLKKLYKNYDSNVSSHSIRKSVANQIYKATGNDIIKTMLFLNHSDPKITLYYLDIATPNESELYGLYALLN